MEKAESVDDRLDPVRTYLAQNAALFARQGAVVASWQTRGGRRRGPYYRLAFRDATNVQRSLYLGADPALAAAVRDMLREIKAPLKLRRGLEAIRHEVRLELRRTRVAMNLELQPLGLYCKGAEIRGWRTGRGGSPNHPR